jgi:hypothetical protein|tara:strand:+ start:3052 stop:3321 length:270 start_codon:yes stop_codon:yes gene_type:complete
MSTFLIVNSIQEFPEDIQDIIYSKIVYPQPKELLNEINKRGTIVNILKTLGQDKTLIKPTLNNIAIAISNLPTNKRKIIIKKINSLIKN